MSPAVSYVLPVKDDDGADDDELARYLRALVNWVDDVIVVDGSDPAARRRRQAMLPRQVRVLTPESVTLNGKVGGVLTGVRHSRHELVVLADDDVRYSEEHLCALADRLGGAAVARPQNCFEPLPWHARIETARILLNRVSSGDWPGTLLVRRSALLDAGGYSGDVMFENLELVRTLQAAGHDEVVALDIVVPRRPPTVRHFLRQQVRQAYDEFARPQRLVLSLAIAPALLPRVSRRDWRSVAALAAAATLAAEAGRRVGRGRRHFPATSSAIAGPWLVWRSLCSWVALGSRLRGGVRYRDARIPRAATRRRTLARNVGSSVRA